MPLDSPSPESKKPEGVEPVGAVVQAEANSFGDKVLRELDLLAGAGSGFVHEAKKAVENPGETTLKVAGSAALGFGLAIVTRKPGMVGLAAKSFGLAGGVAFGTEVLTHGADVSQAVRSSWQSGTEQEANKKIVGSSAGAFLFDTTLMGAAGSAGAIGSKSYFIRQANAKVEIPFMGIGGEAAVGNKLILPKHSEVAQLYKGAIDKVGRVEALAMKHDALSGQFGTAFAVGKDGKMVTNYHVVKDALELTVFDRFGRAHKADVVKTSDFDDLALLQLRDPKAAAHFDAVPISGSTAVKNNLAGEPLYAVGYPNGWQKPFLSPGETMQVAHVRPLDTKIMMHTENGNSGGPILDASGGLVGVLKQGDRNSSNITLMTPAERVEALLGGTKGAIKPFVTTPAVVTRQRYEIADGEAAARNIEKIFPLEKRLDGSSAFFHSKITRVPIVDKSNIQELILRSQYEPHSRSIVVEPLALDGKALAADMVWPGTTIPIKSGKLTVSLDRNQVPTGMEALNDPKMFLRRAFDHKSTGNYLAGLEPTLGPASINTPVKKSMVDILSSLAASLKTPNWF